MTIRFDTKGGFPNAEAWLKRMGSINPETAVRAIASDGTRSLASNTPKKTGETAAGWKEKITRKGNVVEVAWINTAHPEAGVNLAKLIDLGHGTGTGGYVPPKPYIRRAMNPVWQGFDNKVIKGMIK